MKSKDDERFVPHSDSNERHASVSNSEIIRKCEVPWHSAVELGPFYLLSEPIGGPFVRTLCRVTNAEDFDIIRFKPPYIDFSASNYTNRTSIEVWKCVDDNKIPSISCGTTSRGAPLADETYDYHPRHHPGIKINRNKTKGKKKSHHPKVKISSVRISNLKNGDTLLSFSALAVLLITTWWLLRDKSKKQETPKKRCNPLKRKKERCYPAKRKPPNKQRIMDSKSSNEQKKENRLKGRKSPHPIRYFSSNDQSETSEISIDFHNNTEDNLGITTSDDCLSEEEPTKSLKKYSNSGKLFLSEQIKSTESSVERIQFTKESNYWEKIESKRIISKLLPKIIDASPKKNAKTAVPTCTNANTKTAEKSQILESSNIPPSSDQVQNKPNVSLDDSGNINDVFALHSTNTERTKSSSKSDEQKNSPSQFALKAGFDNSDDSTIDIVQETNNEKIKGKAMETIKPPPGFSERRTSLSSQQSICDIAEQQISFYRHQKKGNLRETMLNANDYAANDISTAKRFTIFIDGMMCGGCASSASNALEQMDDVISASVNLSLGTATLKCSNARIDLHALAETLERIGLKAYLNLDILYDTDNSKKLMTRSSLGPIGPPKQMKKESPLMLLDQLRLGDVNTRHNGSNDDATRFSKRRYRCSCGCKECICSDHPLIVGDEGVDINLAELCSRLEKSLGWESTKNNNDDHSYRNGNRERVWPSLIEQVQQQNGGSKELRNSIEKLEFPCGCGSK